MSNEIAGDLVVSEEVIADVAGHAATQCYGVVGMAAPNAVDGLAKLLPKSRLRRGIVVSTDDEGTLVSLYVILEHGVNISTVSENLVEQVSFALKEFVRTPLKAWRYTYRELRFAKSSKQSGYRVRITAGAQGDRRT